METLFVNYALDKAISNYINYADNKESIAYNSFLCVVARLLVEIYGEMDILGPYNNDKNIEIFKLNLTKFGYEDSELESFFNNLDNFEITDSRNVTSTIKLKNKSFINVQKNLIDMFIKKIVNYNVSESEINSFYHLLYTNEASNPLMISYNYLMAENPYEIEEYFKNAIKNNKKKNKKDEKHLLNIKAYEILGFESSDIEKMTGRQIDKLNNKIYDYFKIKKNAINREYLLEKEIEKIEKANSVITSGNGYVDILIILGIVVTSLMIIVLVISAV